MLFTSYQFMGFLIVLFLAYYLIPRRFQWQLLLAASYLFYFLAGADYLIYILVTTVTVFAAARWMDSKAHLQKAYLKEHKEELSKEEKKVYKEGQKKLRRRGLVLCMLLNLGILAVLKYTNFVIANVNAVMQAAGRPGGLSFVTLALPMGISFYTFQSIGYLIDVYRGTVPAEKSLARYALFVSFFPQLVQGPISRFGDLSASLYAEHPFDRETVARGLQRMLWGYFKKMVVADRLMAGVMTMIGAPETYNGAYAVVLMLLYTLELYADFTGGIDITIGVAQTMGITVTENFNRPYFSKSLKEYWRRWHITMCTWFRDYIFYPVSTSKWMQRFTKFSKSRMGAVVGRRLPVYVSSFLVWLATGVWHGASWNFIVWGLANWAVLMISEEFEPLYDRFHKRFPALTGSWGYRLFRVLRTFVLICVLNLFDCFSSMGTIWGLFGSVFTVHNWGVLADGSLLKLGLTGLDFGVAAFGVALMIVVSLVQRKGSVREKIGTLPYPARFLIWYGLFLLVVLLGAYGIGYDASQFIYNQF